MRPINIRVIRARALAARRGLGEDLRRMRFDAALSQAVVAAAAGISQPYLCRIEAGTVEASHETLLRVGAVLGADLSIRFFSNTGPLVHDRIQLPMSECLVRATSRRWHDTPELAVRTPVRGVIDHVLEDRSGPTTVAAELQGELRRVEQQVRWSGEKADALAMLPEQHGRRVSRLLVLRNTHAMRELARSSQATLAAAYPASTAAAIAALTADAPWPGNAIAWMTVERGGARLLEAPPRGVRLGR